MVAGICVSLYFALRRRTNELHSQVSLYEELISAIPDGLYQSTPDGRFIRVNEAMAQMLGYDSTDDLMKIYIPRDLYFHPKERDALNRKLEKLRSDEIDVFRLKKKDGSELWVEDHSIAILDESGKPIYYRGLLRDITARREAEKKLDETRKRLQNLLDNTYDIFIDCSPELKVITVSERVVDVLGHPAEELIGTEFHTLLPLNSPVREKLIQFSEQGEQESIDLSTISMRHANGSWHYFHGTVMFIYGDGRKKVHIALRDVHQQAVAEKALRDSEARYRALVENFPALILQLDLQQRVTFASPSLKRLCGFSQTDAYDDDFLERFISPENRDEFEEALLEAVDEKTSRFELTVNTVDGHKRRAMTTVFPLYNLGQIASICVIVQDITREKMLQEQLQHAQKMETIGTLARGIAHDFNNLLTGIIGNINFVRSEMNADELYHTMLGEAEHAAERCAEMTRNLLAFSRHEQASIEPADINGLIRDTVHMARRTVPPTIEIHLELAPEISAAAMDYGKIQQALMNLVVNARDAILRNMDHAAAGRITVRTTEVEINEEFCTHHIDSWPGKFLRIDVSDTGVGIPEKHLSKIFDPFFTTSEVGQGSGLGLSTVFGIVKNHNGWIDVKSTVGEGTTFQIYLPVAERTAVLDGEETNAEPAGGHETILIVDDEDVVRNFAATTLERVGYHILQAADSFQALELYKKHRTSIDLLLLDITMPNMDGIELLRRLRTINHDVKAILSSGYTEGDTIISELLDQETSFLPKPYISQELARIVREVLDQE